MNNKEILEIKKLIKKSDNSSARLCGCYVAGEEKKKLTYINDYLANLPDEDQHKFVEILRKAMSGAKGKALFDLNFTDEAEQEGGAQASLLMLRDSELKNDALLDAYYDNIIEKFDYTDNYLILVMHDTYGVPVKTKDNIKMDESEEMYSFIVSCICPVTLSKPALSYHEDTNSIENRIQDRVVDMPCIGFTFPAFNDRSADIHSLLYYAKSAKEMYGDFITQVLGCTETIPSVVQKEIFNDIIEDVVIGQPDIEVVDVVRDVNDTISLMIDNNTSEEPVVLDKQAVKDILSQNGVSDELLEKVDTKYETELGDDFKLEADNVMEKRRFEVKTNDVTVNVSPEKSAVVKIKMVDGMKCLVIPMDDNVEINGIMSKVREELENYEQ